MVTAGSDGSGLWRCEELPRRPKDPRPEPTDDERARELAKDGARDRSSAVAEHQPRTLPGGPSTEEERPPCIGSSSSSSAVLVLVGGAVGVLYSK